jgi:hypothetical protein
VEDFEIEIGDAITEKRGKFYIFIWYGTVELKGTKADLLFLLVRAEISALAKSNRLYNTAMPCLLGGNREYNGCTSSSLSRVLKTCCWRWHRWIRRGQMDENWILGGVLAPIFTLFLAAVLD